MVHYDLIGRNVVLEKISLSESSPAADRNHCRYRLVLIDFGEAKSLRPDAGESGSLNGKLKRDRSDVFGVLAKAFGKDTVVDWMRNKLEIEKDGPWRSYLEGVCKWRQIDLSKNLSEE